MLYHWHCGRRLAEVVNRSHHIFAERKALGNLHIQVEERMLLGKIWSTKRIFYGRGATDKMAANVNISSLLFTSAAP